MMWQILNLFEKVVQCVGVLSQRSNSRVAGMWTRGFDKVGIADVLHWIHCRSTDGPSGKSSCGNRTLVYAVSDLAELPSSKRVPHNMLTNCVFSVRDGLYAIT